MRRFRFYHYVIFFVFGALLFVLSNIPSIAQENAATLTLAEAAQLQCRPAVDRAMIRVGNSCSILGNNSACYGYNRVGAIFSQAVGDSYFANVSDQADVPLIRRIQTTPNTLDSPDWGIAILNLLANLPNSLPGRGAMLLMVGGSDLESRLDEENTLSEVALEVTTSRTALIRAFPNSNSNVITQVAPAITLIADAQSEDGEWLRVVYRNEYGWISRVILEHVEMETLPVLTDDTLTPMQVFTFNTGIGRPRCGVAPDMLVIQTPHGRPVTFNINEADVTIGSTVILKTNGINSNVLQDEGQVEVTQVDYHPNNERVAVGYKDGFVRIWNIANPERVTARWQAHIGAVIGLRYIQVEDRDILITAGTDGSVSIYDDSASLKLLYTLPNSTQPVSSFAASGSVIALGHDDGTISLWDTVKGVILAEINAHSSAVTALAFSADGLQLASGGMDAAVRLWDVSTGALLQTFSGHLKEITGIDFRPDGVEIASSSYDETIRLWNLSDGSVRRLNSGLVHSVRYSINSRLLGAAADDNDFQVWMTATGIRQPPMVDHQDSLLSVDFDSTGYYAVTGSSDQMARLWRVTPNIMRLIVADGQASIGSLTIPAGYYSEIGLDESGERVIGDWIPPEIIDLRWSPEYYFLTQFADDLLLYHPVLPPRIIKELIRLGLLPGPAVVSVPSLTPTEIIPMTTPTVTPTVATSTPIPPVNMYSFSGQLFNDLNGDGTQGAGESALEGLTVSVGENPIIGSTVTDANGNYTFNLEEGTYYLSFPTLPGFSYGDGIDPATGETALFTLDADHPVPPISPRFRQTAPFTDLSLTASSNAPLYKAGDEIIMTYTVRNEGIQYATGIKVNIYSMDSGYSFEHISGTVSRGRAALQGTPGAVVGSNNSHYYSWQLGMLAPGKSETFEWRLRALPVPSADSFSTYFNSSLSYDAKEFDLNGANNGGYFYFNRPAEPPLTDVAINLSTSLPENKGAAGAPITYTVTVRNNGPYQADKIVAALYLIGSTYTIDQIDQGSYKEFIEPGLGGFLQWNVGRLEPDSDVKLKLTTRLPYHSDFDDAVRLSVSLTNYEADAPSNAQPLLNNPLENDSSAVDILLDPALIVLSYTTNLALAPNSPSTFRSGDTVTFDWSVKNTGTQNIGDLDLSLGMVALHSDGEAPLPITIKNVEGDKTNFVLRRQTWLINDLNPNESRQLRLTVLINTESLNVNELIMIRVTDDSGKLATPLLIKVPPPDQDLGLTIESDQTDVAPGGVVNLTYSVTHQGVAASENVKVKIAMSPNLTIVDPIPQMFDTKTGLWAIGTLSDTESAELSLKIRANDNQPNPILFMEGRVSTSSREVITANNWATRYLYVNRYTDLSLQISTGRDDPTKIPEGEDVSYIINITNSGLVDATNIQVKVVIPDGLTLATDSIDGIFDAESKTLTFATIEAGGSAGYSLIVSGGTVGQKFKLEAEVSGSDQTDTDSTPNNGVTTEDDYHSYTFTVIASEALPVGLQELVIVTEEVILEITQIDSSILQPTEEASATNIPVEVSVTEEPAAVDTLEPSPLEAPTPTETSLSTHEAESVDGIQPEETPTPTPNSELPGEDTDSVPSEPTPGEDAETDAA